MDKRIEKAKENASEILEKLYKKHEDGEHGMYDITPDGELGEKLVDFDKR